MNLEQELALIAFFEERKPDRLMAVGVTLNMAVNLAVNDAIAKGFIPLNEQAVAPVVKRITDALIHCVQDEMRAIKEAAQRVN